MLKEATNGEFPANHASQRLVEDDNGFLSMPEHRATQTENYYLEAAYGLFAGIYNSSRNKHYYLRLLLNYIAIFVVTFETCKGGMKGLRIYGTVASR